MTILLCSLVSSSFPVLLGYSFLIFFFFFIFACLMVSAFNIPKYLSILFSKRSDFSLIWLFYSFSVICRFSPFVICMAPFSQPNSFPISSLYIFTGCIRVPNSFSFLGNSLISPVYIRWLIFFLRCSKFVSSFTFP